MTNINKLVKNSYKIHRWDSVLFNNSVDPVPVIYLKPDNNLLKFASDNKNAILVEINGTNSIYDKKRIAGLWYKTSDIPHYRPNFFENTGLYVIVLQAPWHSYPDCLGDCNIFGLVGGVPVSSIEDNMDLNGLDNLTTVGEKQKLPSVTGLSNTAMIGILLGIIVLIVIVYSV